MILKVIIVHFLPKRSGMILLGMNPTTPPMVYIPKTIPVLAAAVSLTPIPKYDLYCDIEFTEDMTVASRPLSASRQGGKKRGDI